jgi:hypothetical protein
MMTMILMGWRLLIVTSLTVDLDHIAWIVLGVYVVKWRPGVDRMLVTGTAFQSKSLNMRIRRAKICQYFKEAINMTQEEFISVICERHYFVLAVTSWLFASFATCRMNANFVWSEAKLKECQTASHKLWVIDLLGPLNSVKELTRG